MGHFIGSSLGVLGKKASTIFYGTAIFLIDEWWYMPHWKGLPEQGSSASSSLSLSLSLSLLYRAVLFFARPKRDVLNGLYRLSGHGVHVGIVDGGSCGIEMPTWTP